MVSGEDPRGRLERALDRLEQLDPAVAEPARDLVGALLEVHGEGLARLVGVLAEVLDDPGPVLVELATDPQVSSLLVLHGLHPLDPGTRARQALALAAAQIGPAAADAVVVEVTPSAVELRLGVAAARPELRQALAGAVADAAPELAVHVLDAPPTPRLLPLLR